MWRADLKDLQPVEVACPDGLHPASDADGFKIFSNTHFETAEEARAAIREDVEAGVTLAGCDVISSKRRLRRSEQEAARMAERWARLQEIER